jgi:hypothetical protein
MRRCSAERADSAQPSGKINAQVDSAPFAPKFIIAVLAGSAILRSLQLNLSHRAPPMNRIAMLSTIALVATSVGATPASGPDPEHARLTVMAGTWDVELTFWMDAAYRDPADVARRDGCDELSQLRDGAGVESR